MEIINAEGHKTAVEVLLAENKLPISDLPASLSNFLVAVQNDEVIATAGLEVYGEYGLLRSLAVKAAFRNAGLAGKLLSGIEQMALTLKLGEVYLLTETADKYFETKQYTIITRADVPDGIQQSSEFSSVCPQSAVVMKKTL